MSNDVLTLEKIEKALEELFKENPIPKFHPSVEKEINNFLKEHIDEFYFTDYTTMTSFVNVDNLKKILKENGKI